MEPPRHSTKRKIDTVNKRSRKVPRLSSPISTTPDGSCKISERIVDVPPLPTPPATASLRVIVPQPVLTRDAHRNIKIRQAAALRWASKLRKPFPKRREINEAYNLKLMRHYNCSTTNSEPNFVKPHIDTSLRVMRLLRQFPNTIPTPARRVLEAGNPIGTYATDAQIPKLKVDLDNLQMNKRITRSDDARRLAWQSFCSTEKDRIDNGRQALMESGLAVDDLIKEHQGIRNGLPEWKKRYTGKYAKESKLQQQ